MTTPNRISSQLRLPAPDPSVVALSERYLPQDARVLDAGTGNGRNALYLAQQGHSVTAIEKDPAQLQKACELAQTLGSGALRLRFQEGDIENPLFDSESFDAVFITRVLQELPSIARGVHALKEMQRITKVCGLHVVTTYIGSPKERDIMRHLAIWQPGNIKHIYAENQWQIVHADQQIRPLEIHNDKPILNSHDEIVARKLPTPAPSPQTDLIEYLRRVDPEQAEFFESSRR